mmetsp:Transcript_82126/g.214348  ORF Transcript_82126/g.214348 Transcript_82126/m.214348 type:complete len:209 (+) Transcript_82126:1271-1897(+)
MPSRRYGSCLARETSPRMLWTSGDWGPPPPPRASRPRSTAERLAPSTPGTSRGTRARRHHGGRHCCRGRRGDLGRRSRLPAPSYPIASQRWRCGHRTPLGRRHRHKRQPNLHGHHPHPHQPPHQHPHPRVAEGAAEKVGQSTAAAAVPWPPPQWHLRRPTLPGRQQQRWLRNLWQRQWEVRRPRQVPRPQAVQLQMDFHHCPAVSAAA